MYRPVRQRGKITNNLHLGPEADGAEKLVFLEDRLSYNHIAVIKPEFCLRRRLLFEFLRVYVAAIVGSEEFAVAVVDPGKDDIALRFKGFENGVCVFGVVER